jgi:hypothetical protein
MEPWRQHIPTLNQRPTQPPLNREQQAAAFAQRQQMYAQQAPPTPMFPITPFKEQPISEQQQMEAAKRQMDERGLKQESAKLTEAIEESHTKQTIQQFYCSHVFQVVNAKLSVLPIRYKICKKCGLVK